MEGGAALGVASTELGVAGEVLGVASTAPGVTGRMLGGGGRGPLDGAAGVSRGFGRAGGGGGCWLGCDNAARPRFGGRGGAPEGRDGSTLVPPFGRGGSDTGRGGCAPSLGATMVGSLPIAARFSLSLAVPCSSPMEASAPDPLSIAQIALPLGREPTGAGVAPAGLTLLNPSPRNSFTERSQIDS
jgi:hypothetical protein